MQTNSLTKDFTKGVFVTAKTNATELQRTIGKRLMELRKERGITQIEMAKLLNVAQSVISDYETGNFRLHGDLIVRITKILKISADVLLGLDKTRDNKESAELQKKHNRIYKRLKEIDKLSVRDQEALIRTIDAFLTKN